MTENHVLRLKCKGNRLGPGLISHLNRHTNNAAKTLEQLNKVAAQARVKKTRLLLVPNGDSVEGVLLYPGDAQVYKSLPDKTLEELNKVRASYGIEPLTCPKTLEGIVRSLR